jgi:hypothetical protein
LDFKESREIVYWPGITADNFIVEACSVCASYQQAQQDHPFSYKCRILRWPDLLEIVASIPFNKRLAAIATTATVVGIVHNTASHPDTTGRLMILRGMHNQRSKVCPLVQRILV